MAGTKGSHVSEKLEEAIPLPPFNTTPQSSVPNLRRTRTRKVFLRILTFTLLFFTVHHWYKRSNPEIEEEVESWYANPFSVHRPGIFRAHHGFGHGTGHRVLNGKLAEKLFLYVFHLLFKTLVT